MTDRLMKLYELNERYHDTKEKRAWLATTFYAGFSLMVIKWATNKENVDFLQEHQCTIIVLLFVIFVCVVWFIWFHYRKKRISVKIEGFISKEFSVQNADESLQLARVFCYADRVNKGWWKRTKKQRYLSTEIEIFILMLVFFAAQIFVILTESGTWPLVVKWFIKCFAG